MTRIDPGHLEAYFGRFRVYVNGADVRGFWQKDDADAYAAKIGGKVVEHRAY